MNQLNMRCFQLTAFGKNLKEHKQYAPEPMGTEVLIRVLGAGVCHSDVHLWEGHYDLGSGRKASFADRVKLPLTPGHESSGEVVRVGPDAKGIKVGDKVLACAWIGCGDCEACRAGDEHLCGKARFLGIGQHGGYADYIMLPHPAYAIDLGNLDPVAAAPLACSGITTYSALKKLGPEIQRSPVVIFGAGGLGMMSLGILKLMKGRGAVVVELDPRKREEALKAGALAAIDPRAADAAQQIRKAVGQPLRLVLDLVGSGETMGLSIDLLEKGGKLVIVGLIGGDLSLSVPTIPMKALTIQGSYIGSPAETRELVELIKANGGLPPMPIERRPLDAANGALDDLRQGKVVGRIVLVP